jgi:hypothetical protein
VNKKQEFLCMDLLREHCIWIMFAGPNWVSYYLTARLHNKFTVHATLLFSVAKMLNRQLDDSHCNCHKIGGIRASAAVLNMWPCKRIFTSKFSHILFCNPTHKTETEQIGGGLLIANHLDQSLWWANWEHWAAVRSYLFHSFLHTVPAPFTSRKLWSSAEAKPFPQPSRHILIFLHPILLWRVTYWPPLEML